MGPFSRLKMAPFGKYFLIQGVIYAGISGYKISSAYLVLLSTYALPHQKSSLMQCPNEPFPPCLLQIRQGPPFAFLLSYQRNGDATMYSKRKSSREANADVAVVSTSVALLWFDQGERNIVAMGLPLQTRHELLAQMMSGDSEASSVQKRKLLDEFTSITGYHRKYAMWLLNHTEEGQEAPPRVRPHCYGREVQEALMVAWNAANRICAKLLMPFLPTLIEALERHGHLHLGDICREQLLAMSAATADRLLRVARAQGRRSGLSATRAGTLLKQQIPIRTFQQWNESQPGFLQADMVAHCDADLEGSYLCTLTLTDIATGWTECLPLLYKSQETVLEALEDACELFPFPILGLDTDNGGEFINEGMLSYCEREQITFTRGRPYLKNDQCYVEQKNGAIVRQVVGYDRFVGVQACQQLGELYRGLRLYSNCFQPCMKLQGKQYDGRKIRLIYDCAKTPLQQLLLSGVLPASREQEWKQILQALDPVRLFEQVKDLQQAFFVHSMSASPRSEKTADVPLRRFCVQDCTAGSLEAGVLTAERGSEQHPKGEELPSLSSLLQWHRTRNDPFKDVWELIAAFVLTHPECTPSEIFRELQRLFPQRYQPSQLRTLQRGVRKIRAHLRATVQGQWQQEVIQAEVPDRASQSREKQGGSQIAEPAPTTAFPPIPHPCQQQAREQLFPPHISTEEGRLPLGEEEADSSGQRAPSPDLKQPQLDEPPRSSSSRNRSGQRRSSLSIEQAIQDYLQAQRKGHQRPKTLEWHQTALHLWQHYLLSKHQCVLINEVTERQVQDWLSSLRENPTARGTLRSASTIESYARSARAFCQWLVQKRDLKQTPFAHPLLPQGAPPLLQPLSEQKWEGLLQACQPLGEVRVAAEETVARNQALLWALLETGMRVREMCALHINDVDHEQSRLRVRGKGGKPRWVPLGKEGLRHVLIYLDQYRLKQVLEWKRRRRGEEPLFVSETGHPLTENGIALLFSRLRRRAGITSKDVNPTLLRESFAVRYLQAGGDLFILRELLGQEESAVVKRALRMSEEGIETTSRKG